jgi:hypothetical protein
MASPHVAGVAALLLRYEPTTPAAADRIEGSNAGWGAGLRSLTYFHTGTITNALSDDCPVPTTPPSPGLCTGYQCSCPTSAPVQSCVTNFQPCNANNDCCSE